MNPIDLGIDLAGGHYVAVALLALLLAVFAGGLFAAIRNR